MAEVGEKRMIPHIEGGSVPKKAKTELEDSDNAVLATCAETSPDSDSVSSAITAINAVTLYSEPEMDRISGTLRLKELELFLVSKRTPDEIVNQIKQRRPEEAYSPFEGDVKKALEGFDGKGWCFYPHVPLGDELLFLNSKFTDDDLYRQLVLTDYSLPLYTTYDNDQACLCYLRELKQQADIRLSKYDKDSSHWRPHWSWEGMQLVFDLAQKHPRVGLDHLIHAKKDLNLRFNWHIISPDVERELLDMWMVTNGGRKPFPTVLRKFGKPSLAALLKETFYEVSCCSHDPLLSEDDLILVLKKKIDEKIVGRLLEYYPENIRRKIDIAKQIGII